jgi:hypothetical protein
VRHLDQPLGNAPPQVSIRQAKRNAELLGQRALGDDTALLDRVEHAESDVRLRLRPGAGSGQESLVGAGVHDENVYEFTARTSSTKRRSWLASAG